MNLGSGLGGKREGYGEKSGKKGTGVNTLRFKNLSGGRVSVLVREGGSQLLRKKHEGLWKKESRLLVLLGLRDQGLCF